VLALLALILIVNELRPVGAVPAAQTAGTSTTVPGDAVSVPWPASGQAAIGGRENGVLASSPNARPAPIASVAKVMTALAVLAEKPLKADEDGPAITIVPDDVTEYQQEAANQESVVAVQAGEQLSERQALEALLIPSGNNIAAELARWASGSVDAHVQRMNAMAKRLGMRRTTFADVSGLSEKTVSVPADLVRLGQAALDQPAVADIVSEPQVTLPVAGVKYNVNYVLGQDGIFGIKTGNTTAGGAIYLFAGDEQLAGGAKATVVGAVQGLSTLDGAFNAAKALLRTARASLRSLHVASKDQTVGRYTLPWGGGSDVVAATDLDILVLPGMVVRESLQARPVEPPISPRTGVGSLRVTAGDAEFDLPVVNADQLYGPGRLARATRLTW